MKKLFLIIFLILFLAPYIVEAGLVPCGGCEEFARDVDGKIIVDPDTGKAKCTKPQPPCQLCHIFVLFDNILNFIFFTIVPPLAILMVAIAGAYFLFAAGNPTTLTQAKSMLRTTAIALVIIYGAWLFVHLVLTFPGLIKTDFEGWKPSEWFQIDCPIAP